MKKQILILAAIFTLNSCVIYPNKHTYFYPDPSNEGSRDLENACSDLVIGTNIIKLSSKGIPISSASRIEVTPSIDNELAKSFYIRIVIYSQTRDISFDPNKIYIEDTRLKQKFKANKNSTNNTILPGIFDGKNTIINTTVLYFNNYPNITHMNVFFENGALKYKGKNISLSPLGFTKKSGMVLSYGSINC